MRPVVQIDQVYGSRDVTTIYNALGQSFRVAAMVKKAMTKRGHTIKRMKGFALVPVACIHDKLSWMLVRDVWPLNGRP